MARNQAALATFAEIRAALVDYAAGIVGSRASAEDVVQEAWLRLDGTATAGPAINHPRGYIYRIVRNLAFDAARRGSFERRHFAADDSLAEAVSDGQASPEDALSHRQELAIVMAALEELPARTREAVTFYRFHGLKLKEVADRLGISVGLAHSLVADGLAHCRDRLRQSRGTG